MLDRAISILLTTYGYYLPTLQGQAAQSARENMSPGFAANYAAQPARKNRSPGFAAKSAARLMDDNLTAIPIMIELQS